MRSQQFENLSAKSGGAIRLGCIAAAIENGKIALDTEDEVAPALAAVLHGLIAAEMTGRRCCGLEISPAYVDIVVQGWQDFTGRVAIHHPSGQSFAERTETRQQDRSGSADA